MSKVKFELNKNGVRELLQSPETGNIVSEYAYQVLSRAGNGYDIDSFTGFDRVHAIVSAATYEAQKDNYDNNTLLKALGGVR